MATNKRKIHINEAKALVVEAVMRHHEQNMAMTWTWQEPDYDGEWARDKYQAFLVAVQVLDSLYPEAQDWTGEEMREFARACGVCEDDIAHIHDDEPNAIY